MKKMMVLSLVFSVMALGTAMANDANAMANGKPKNVYVSINVPLMGHMHGNDRPCPPPPPHKCDCNHGKKHGPNNHNCCPPKPHHGKPGGNHDFKPNGKPGGNHGGAPAGRPGDAPGGRPVGNHNGAPGRR